VNRVHGTAVFAQRLQCFIVEARRCRAARQSYAPKWRSGRHQAGRS
jgi:hypothetical protein